MGGIFSFPSVDIDNPSRNSLVCHSSSSQSSSAHGLDNRYGEHGSQSQQLCDVWRDIQGAHNWNGVLDPMDPILKAEALRYGDFSKVCYDAFDGVSGSKYYGTCKYSKRELLEKMGMSECGYRVTEYIYANTDVLGSLFGDKSKDRAVWLGFIAVCENAKEIKRLGRRDIVVAWRGTQTTQEWIQDLRDVLVPARLSYICQRTRKARQSVIPSVNDGVRIEKGFLNCYTSSMPQQEDSAGNLVNLNARALVIAEIRRLLEVYENEIENLSITFTGHSLGAALATLSAYDTKQALRDNYFTDVPVTVFSFASPRVGNLAFAKNVEDIGLKVLRLVIKRDVIPKVPGVFLNEKMGCVSRWLSWLPWTYFHVGEKVCLVDNSPRLSFPHNLAYFHSLDVYLHLLATSNGGDI